MTPRTIALLVAAFLILHSAFAHDDAELTELGGGLLMRSDGSVVAVWELPDCGAEAEMFSAPDAPFLSSGHSDVAWRSRLVRD